MAEFDTYFGETDDGGYYAFLDLTIPFAWEPGTSSEGVLDALHDVIAYAEEMRRAIHLLEQAGAGVAVSEEYEDTLDVYFETREAAEEALRALEARDLLDFLVEEPAELVAEHEGEREGLGNGHGYLN